MLVTFETKAHANITMFGEVAVTLLKLMGHSGTVPGALLAADVPTAVERLRRAVSEHPDTPLDPASGAGAQDGGEERHVSLAHRAQPLIDLLSDAAAAHENVMWGNP
ncbi:MAG TPA: DUF1840 domain-containing protein [Lamprocystis sp. (in: g-proteobacteria)]|nr:DUF1840 domain-containing protein [Lamprocystis sp. (in: g-proteobacteria)]